ncbi:hypothetical protein CEXT_390881 [Caerostris extrusa]|uniref:Uncharacterized protein n=1 Tax=Caerostris extrusa TaxID=172846 RepID=A0AAV4VXY1_CAEEX|nr:hypothetical protein CEXT_390881 [Caerostris extrusa]
MDGNFPKTSRIIIICYLFHQLHPLPCSRFPTDYMGDSFHCSVFLALGTPRNVQCRQFTLCPLSPVQMSLKSPWNARQKETIPTRVSCLAELMTIVHKSKFQIRLIMIKLTRHECLENNKIR